MRHNAYLSLLSSNEQYRKLFAARSISLAGDWLNTIAIFVLLEQITDDPTTAFGWVLILKFLPQALLGFFAGIIADRFSRTKVMIISDLLRAVTVPCFLLVMIWPSTLLVYMLLAIQAGLAALFEPSKSALLPDIVHRNDLLIANALDSIMWSSMLAFGSAIGGVLTEFMGWQLVILLDASSYLVSAYYVSKITYDLSSGTSTKKKASTALTPLTGFADLRAAYLYLRDRPQILALSLIKGCFCIAACFGLILAVFGREVYSIGSTTAMGISLLYTARGLGTAFGPVISRRLAKNNPRHMRYAILGGFLVSGFSYFLFSFNHNLYIGLLLIFIAHLGGSTLWVFSTVLLQQNVDFAFRGRVFGIELAIFTTTLSASLLFYSYMLKFNVLSPFTAVRLLSISIITMGVLWFFTLRLWKKDGSVENT